MTQFLLEYNHRLGIDVWEYIPTYWLDSEYSPMGRKTVLWTVGYCSYTRNWVPYGGGGEERCVGSHPCYIFLVKGKIKWVP